MVVTNDAGTSSNISVSVTGLPITYTDANGKPVAKVGDNYYPVKEDGTPDTTATPIQAGDLVTNLANPTAKGNEIGTPTQLGNVANGAKTFDAPKNGSDDLKLANDGKWYPSTQVNPNGTTVANATPVTPSNVGKSGLVDFANSNPNNAATVGDLQNMGWVVSSDKTTGNLSAQYNDQVRNTNEVKFVGTNLAIVSGITNATTGVRTITVDVNAQDVVEAAQTPVVYTDSKGNKLVKGNDGNFYPADSVKIGDKYYPADSVKIGDKYYPAGTTTDATGNPVNNGAAAAPVTGTKPADVIASMNDGNSTTTAPMALANVKSNLPNVNDKATTITHPNGTTVAADANNIKKAPLTADQAAEIATNNANNAATIGDVLNAGWNLQNNGEARDFVKPFDTVNFVNGGNTKAVVTTDANGTTSDVAIHVIGLPVTYTDANGNPVAKVGDNYYPVDENGNPITKKADGSDADPIDATTLKTRLTNPSAKPNAIGDATQLGNVNSGLSNYAEPNGDGKAPAKNSLRNLSDSTEVPDTIAATVGDLRNLGWIVSSDKTTGGNGAFSNAVKNANEVRFVGEGSALVSGNVTTDGVNVVTVKVDDQLTTNNSVTPVVYTKADGTKVYPVKDADGNVTYNTQPDGKGDTVADGDVITSVNGLKGTKAPTTLANVKSNLPQVNDADQTIYNPATNTTTAKAPNNANINKAPLTATQAAEIAKNNASNAATVGDVLNAGWNLQNNGEARDFVKPYDTVNFVNGTGTIAVVTTDANGTTSDVTFNVDKGTVTNETNGSVTGPVAKDLLDKLDAAKTALAADPDNADLKKALEDAQTAVDNAGGNKVATAQNVADAINNAGWNTNSTTATGGATNTLIKPSKAVNFEAGKNIEVTQKVENGNVSYTYATKSEVEFDKVTVGNGTTTSPVEFKAEKAKPATNNGDNNPTTALNITSVDGKSTQITGVASSLNTTTVNTTPTGNAGDKPAVTFVDLNGSDAAPVNKNAAATVGDLANMGWVVSSDKTTDGEGAYKDAVKNANEVKFVGEGTALVSGKTVEGVRTITVKVNDQLTTNNSITPVVYTTTDGTQVYPVKDADGNVTYNTKPDGTGDVVTGDVITSVNGSKGTKAPTTFANVKSNLPQVNDADQTIYNPATNTTTAKQDGNANINKAPLTAAEAANIAKTAGNNAATVYDVLNAGWNLQNNGEARDFVKPYDTVNFVNGTGTIAVVTTDANGTASDVTFNVDKGTITNEANGSVTGPVSTELNEALKNAQEAAKKAQEEAAANPTDQALQDAAKKAQDAVNAAQDAVDNAGNKVATAQNVVDAINNTGWNTNSTTAKGGATNTLIKPSKAVNFEAGKNMEVTQTVDENGNVSYTYATQDNVSFNTVNVGNPTESYTDENGDVVTKKGDKFFDKDGNEIDPAKVTTTIAPSVKLAA
nr:hypothetical protein [uncultured Haemophilus sp.]